MEPIKILIVEDSPLEAEEMRIFANRAGYVVTDVCKSGETALGCIVKNKPDLVLFDIHLAGELDGVESANIVKKSWNLPVVFLTSDPRLDTMTRMKRSGGDFFLPKPFNEQQFRTAIEYSLIDYALHSGNTPRPVLQLSEHFFFYYEGAYRKVAVADILCIEAARHQSVIFLKGKDSSFIVNLHLKVIENLQHPQLIRIHRSMIVNSAAVEAVQENNYLLLTGGKKVIFSQTYLPNPGAIFPIVTNS